jgi:hypothetical protein
VRRIPWHQREAQLLQYLDEKPYLFVLDGLERTLIAYQRMDASYLMTIMISKLQTWWQVPPACLPRRYNPLLASTGSVRPPTHAQELFCKSSPRPHSPAS